MDNCYIFDDRSCLGYGLNDYKTFLGFYFLLVYVASMEETFVGFRMLFLNGCYPCLGWLVNVYSWLDCGTILSFGEG